VKSTRKRAKFRENFSFSRKFQENFRINYIFRQKLWGSLIKIIFFFFYQKRSFSQKFSHQFLFSRKFSRKFSRIFFVIFATFHKLFSRKAKNVFRKNTKTKIFVSTLPHNNVSVNLTKYFGLFVHILDFKSFCQLATSIQHPDTLEEEEGGKYMSALNHWGPAGLIRH
jgi:hypothetical protein